MDRPQGIPDWRHAEAYEQLLQVDSAGLAWEWLRRRADYVWSNHTSVPATMFGLERFEDPTLGALRARPLWQARVHPFVLKALATRSAPGPDAFDINRHRALATILDEGDVAHILLSDGYRSIRLDIEGASPLAGPVVLDFSIRGLKAARPQILSFQRLVYVCDRGRLSTRLHCPPPRASRQVLLLRAFDGVQSGASQRDLAAQLLDVAAGGTNWRIDVPSLRSQAQRLVRDGRTMITGGFLRLLR